MWWYVAAANVGVCLVVAAAADVVCVGADCGVFVTAVVIASDVGSSG